MYWQYYDNIMNWATREPIRFVPLCGIFGTPCIHV